MSLTPAMIDAMLEAGCTAEQIAAVVKAALSDGEKKAEEKRAKDAERQRKSRANRALSRDVTVTECDACDEPLPSPSPSFPPDPQTNPTPAHPRVNKPRARETDDFPRPDWADTQVWADFLANRKRKKLNNTATAYRGFLRDIEKLTDADWPPGRLLEHATAKGWGAIYDPRDQDDFHGNQPTRSRQPAFQPTVVSLRGPRPDPAIDMLRQAQADLAADPGEDQRFDRQGRVALPSYLTE